MDHNTRRTLHSALSLALVLLSCLASAQAQTTLNPTADAYVQGGANAGTNFGTNTQLRIQTNATAANNYDSYLKFDTTGQTFATAKVRVNASLSASGTVGVALYAVATTTWGETTINWNNKPARGAQQATTVNVTSTTAAWIEFDVTTYVLAEKAAGRPVVSFALHAPSNTSVRVNASSRNATSNKPQLVLTATANNPPTVTLTAPANNSTYTAPATINLTATAADSDGTVSKVEFFQGTTLIGTATTSPYTATWSNAPAGVYSLTAKATDNLNASTTSTPVAITINPPVQAYYIHSDHLNTPRLISDQTQKTVWRWQNTEGFGNTLAEEDPDADGTLFTCNLRYPGQYYDKETALHYNYFRDYDPSTGRYVESDPIGLKGGINTYTYVDGDPVSFIDPFGLELTPAQKAAVVAAAKNWVASKVKYVTGGATKEGADCSGAISGVYKQAGIGIGRVTSGGKTGIASNPLFAPVTGTPQTGDIGLYPGHVVLFGGGDVGVAGLDSWSASHPGGPDFRPASSSWYGNGVPTWYRYK